MNDIYSILEHARRDFKTGQYNSAKIQCEKALNLDNNQPDAWNLLGMIAQYQGHIDMALKAYRNALTILPGYPDAYHNIVNILSKQNNKIAALEQEQKTIYPQPFLAQTWRNIANWLQNRVEQTKEQVIIPVALTLAEGNKPEPTQNLSTIASSYFHITLEKMNLGEIETAENFCRQGLILSPSAADGWTLAGILARKRQDLLASEWALRLATSLQKNYADPWYHLAVTIKFLGRLPEACASMAQACSLQPNNSVWLSQLSIWYQEAEQWTDALETIESALQTTHDNPAIWRQKGHLLFALRRFHEAADIFKKALSLQPQLFENKYHYGIALQNDQQFQESIAIFQQLTKDFPNTSHSWFNLGLSAQQAGQFITAEKAYQQTLQIEPNHLPASYNLSELYHSQKRWSEALKLSHSLSTHHPTLMPARILLAKLRLKICDWNGLTEDLHTLLHDLTTPQGNLPTPSPFSFLSFPIPITEAQQTKLAVNYCQSLTIPGDLLPPYEQKEGGRLRIGYASSDFRNHPIAQLMLGLFQRHDRKHFEIFVYSWGENDNSHYRQHIQTTCDHFTDLIGKKTDTIAQIIRKDNIDILVDLNGHTNGSRPELFALRPAPIQITYLGYPGSYGADFIDYAIVDAFVVPLAQRGLYTECLLDMPNCYLITDCDQPIAEHLPSRIDCGLPTEGFIYCCFCAHYKIEPIIFTVWMRILHAVPNSVLWLLQPNDPQGCTNLQREATLRGIEPSRILFAPHLPRKEEHLSRLRHADLFLDTLFYNAHTTASDALWAGVPVLTKPGKTFASRVGGSLNRAVGLAKLNLPNLAAYETMAIALATYDNTKLKKYRAHLTKNRKKLPLFDTNRFTRDLEAQYHRLSWELPLTNPNHPTATPSKSTQSINKKFRQNLWEAPLTIDEAWKHITLTTMSHPDYSHSAAFKEIIDTLFYGFQTLGCHVERRINSIDNTSKNIIFCAHMLNKELMESLPEGNIIYNLEPLESTLFGEIMTNYRMMLTKQYVWDYSLHNLDILGTFIDKNKLFHVPIGYVPELTRITPAPFQDIDLLFYGSLNDRRLIILNGLREAGLAVYHAFNIYGTERDTLIARAKVVLNLHLETEIFEIIRVSYLLANRKAVVSECNPGTKIDKNIQRAIMAVPRDQIVQACCLLTKDDLLRQKLEQQGFDIFSRYKEEKILSKTIKESYLRTTLSKQGRLG
ncbi:MAG: tetratricopeptide repeat protein [Magnetococcus sp. DMHC-6]